MRPNRFRIERLLEEPIECQQITTASTLEELSRRRIRALKRIYEREETLMEEEAVQPLSLQKSIEEQHNSVMPMREYMAKLAETRYKTGFDSIPLNPLPQVPQPSQHQLAQQSNQTQILQQNQPTQLTQPIQSSQQVEIPQPSEVPHPPHQPQPPQLFPPVSAAEPANSIKAPQQQKSASKPAGSPQKKNIWQSKRTEASKPTAEYGLFGLPRQSLNSNQSLLPASQMLSYSYVFNFSQKPVQHLDLTPEANKFSETEVCQSNKHNEEELMKLKQNDRINVDKEEEVLFQASTVPVAAQEVSHKPEVSPSISLFSRPEDGKEFTGPSVKMNLGAPSTSLFSNPVGTPPPVATTGPQLTTNNALLFANTLTSAPAAVPAAGPPPPPSIFQSIAVPVQDQPVPAPKKPNSSLFGNFATSVPGIIPSEVKLPTTLGALEKYARPPGTQPVQSKAPPINQQTPLPKLFSSPMPHTPASLLNTINETVNAHKGQSLFGQFKPEASKSPTEATKTTPPLNVGQSPISNQSSSIFGSLPVPQQPIKPVFSLGTVVPTESPHGIFAKVLPQGKSTPLSLFTAPTINPFGGPAIPVSDKTSQPSLAAKSAEPEPKKPMSLFDVSVPSIFNIPADKNLGTFAQFQTPAASSVFGNLPQTNVFSQLSGNPFGAIGHSIPQPKHEDEEEEGDDDDDGPLEQEQHVDPTQSTGNYVYESFTDNLFKAQANHFRKNDNTDVFRDVTITLEKAKSSSTYNIAIRLPKTNVITYQGVIMEGKTRVDYMNNNHQNVKVSMAISMVNNKPHPDLLKIQFKQASKGEQFFNKMKEATKQK